MWGSGPASCVTDEGVEAREGTRRACDREARLRSSAAEALGTVSVQSYYVSDKLPSVTLPSVVSMSLHWLSVLFIQQGSPGTGLQTDSLPGCGGPVARHVGTATRSGRGDA